MLTTNIDKYFAAYLNLKTQGHYSDFGCKREVQLLFHCITTKKFNFNV